MPRNLFTGEAAGRVVVRPKIGPESRVAVGVSVPTYNKSRDNVRGFMIAASEMKLPWLGMIFK